jgi:hypothetical protein
MLNARLIQAFMNSFYGYGNLQSQLWFIGMEEGGGHTLSELELRLEAWRARGQLQADDVRDYHIQIEMGDLFAPDARLQPTWAQLIRTIITAKRQRRQPEGHLPGEVLLDYQKNYFGRSGANHAVLEFLPLPSPNVRAWCYGAGQGTPLERWTDVPFLQSRATYQRCLREVRVRGVRDLIAAHRPRMVVFYGESYRPLWARIAQYRFVRGDYALSAPDEYGTRFALLTHPTPRYRPAPVALYEQVGTALAREGVLER